MAFINSAPCMVNLTIPGLSDSGKMILENERFIYEAIKTKNYNITAHCKDNPTATINVETKPIDEKVCTKIKYNIQVKMMQNDFS